MCRLIRWQEPQRASLTAKRNLSRPADLITVHIHVSKATKKMMIPASSLMKRMNPQVASAMPASAAIMAVAITSADITLMLC